MPIYEYQCSQCGHQEEVIQKISDEPLKKCSECGESTMVKMVSAPSFRLKGGGWYETDFKSGDKKNVVDSGGDKKSPKEESSKKSSSGSTSTTKKAGSTKK